MKNTRFCIDMVKGVLPVGVVLLSCLFRPAPALSQAEAWRADFAAGEEARKAGDAETYARRMAAAVEGLPADHLNRPFAQYHTARAFALQGDAASAARYLGMAWDEGIEALMISFAHHDPAFDAVRDDPAYAEVMVRASSMELSVSRLGGSVHLIHGAGSQVVASVGADGVLLVDTGYGAALPALRSALSTLGHPRVTRLVLTHPHEDHWGGAAELAAEARVQAHPGTIAAMAEPYTFMEGVVLPPKPDALRDGVEPLAEGAFRFNGEEVRVFPVVAHTGGDVAVLFNASKVLHLGDAYLGGNPMMFPGGEDPDGFLDRLDAFLDAAPEGTVVVGGHDDPVDVAAVREQIAVSRGCMELVRKALAEGLTRDETVARAEGTYAAPWVRFFYGALSAG